MKNKLIVVLFLCINVIPVFAQDLSSDYKVTQVNKKVRDISIANPCASSLENYMARIHLWIDGRYDTIYSEMVDAAIRKSPPNPDYKKNAERLLNSEVKQEIIYKDSIAWVFWTDTADPDSYIVGLSQWENGKWLGCGEYFCAKNRNDINQWVKNKSDNALSRLRKFNQLKQVTTDTIAFTNYLNAYGKEPIPYLLDKLKIYPLVIYGEFHFRKNSWDLLQQLIKSPEFAANVGTVFLELSQSAQSELDQFFKSQTKDPNLILSVFRKEEITGWNDKGMYDFLLELWDVNRLLKNKINVVAADYSRIFYQNIVSKEQYDSIEKIRYDRNEIMTEIIENTIHNSPDKRNHLFIVGWTHAYKSPAPAYGSLHMNGLSAGYLLSEKLGAENVFSIFPHTIIMTNHGDVLGKIRNGLFDYVFTEYGNKPIAFDLHNSVFGNELFDADDMILYDGKTGTFANNFDGYIFLQPVQEEKLNASLYELYTDEFVNEIKRRAKVIDEKTWFWEVEVNEDFNRQLLLDKLRESESKKRWDE